ncbi:unnamed protein product [Rotaria sordida]|uniref:Uncharacterized protein n=1 Tax=Rotaria sordida TaxID=392033 RepID=A0A814PI81_9BILA|nr:unnamed protein product [Rotaria sordida]CAF1310830.1 unnamed protein product [Rotaria sordida]
MFIIPNTDTLKCPITCELFREPVTGQDGHTYERDAIITWLKKNGTSPITREPMTIESLRPNHTVKQLIDEFKSSSSQKHFLFKFGVDIKKAERRAIFQAPGKAIYRAEWISKPGPAVVLLKIDGAKASREASYYVQLGCHPHIVHTYGMVENDANSLMLVQEYASEGDLAELLRENEFRPSQSVLLEIFLQIIDAMVYLADYGIVHGDLACRNVLVFRFNDVDPQQNLVKLTDFGLTRASTLYSVVGSTAATTLVVVPLRYAAPEILQNSGLSNYSEKSDVYSMGILMWEACSQGQLPYASIEDDNEVRRYKLKGEILNRPENCDETLWNIIVRCWHRQSEARPTFKMLKQSLLELQKRWAAARINKFRDAGAGYLADALKKNQTLTTLYLPGNKIGDTGAKYLADALKNNQILTTLNLLLCGITDAGVQHLAEALRNNQTLTTLHLSSDQIGNAGAKYLADVLKNNKALTALYLSGNKISDTGAEYLADALKNNQTLTTLNLEENEIADAGAQKFAGVLQIIQTLTILELRGNKIGNAGAQHLVEARETNQTLTKLTF